MADGFDVAAMKRLPKGRDARTPSALSTARSCATSRCPACRCCSTRSIRRTSRPLRRCYAFGKSLARAIRSWPADARVAVIASGGLTPFRDRRRGGQVVLDAIRERDIDSVAALGEPIFQAGTSESEELDSRCRRNGRRRAPMPQSSIMCRATARKPAPATPWPSSIGKLSKMAIADDARLDTLARARCLCRVGRAGPARARRVLSRASHSALGEGRIAGPGRDRQARHRARRRRVRRAIWARRRSRPPNAGHVIVIEQSTGIDAGCWGGLLTLGAKMQGHRRRRSPTAPCATSTRRGPRTSRSSAARSRRARRAAGWSKTATNVPVRIGDVDGRAAATTSLRTAARWSFIRRRPNRRRVLDAAESIATREAAMADALAVGNADPAEVHGRRLRTHAEDAIMTRIHRCQRSPCRALDTATLSDALDRLGCAGQCRGIKPRDPRFRMAGRAFTFSTAPRHARRAPSATTSTTCRPAR